MFKSKAFTLVEILLTLSFITIITGVFYTVYERYSISSEANTVSQNVLELAGVIDTEYSKFNKNSSLTFVEYLNSTGALPTKYLNSSLSTSLRPVFSFPGGINLTISNNDYYGWSTTSTVFMTFNLTNSAHCYYIMPAIWEKFDTSYFGNPSGYIANPPYPWWAIITPPKRTRDEINTGCDNSPNFFGVTRRFQNNQYSTLMYN